MNINEVEIKKLSKLLNTTSKVSNIELPALLLGVMSIIPGFLDEAFLGIGAMAVYGVVAFLRHYLKSHRKEIIDRLESESAKGNISSQEIMNARKSLNILTVAGGEKTS